VPAPTDQLLRLLDGELVVERHAAGGVPAGGDWLALVRGSDGLTVVRRRGPEDAGAEPWRAFEGDTEHALDAPGMLVAVLSPLSGAGIPVFACSTFAADIVLVPAGRVGDAVALLERAGHRVRPG
jgi:hypothetical protein